MCVIRGSNWRFYVTLASDLKVCQDMANPLGGGRTGGARGGQGNPLGTRLPWAMGGPSSLGQQSPGASGSPGGTPDSGGGLGLAGGTGPPGEGVWGRGPKCSILFLMLGAGVPHIFD